MNHKFQGVYPPGLECGYYCQGTECARQCEGDRCGSYCSGEKGAGFDGTMRDTWDAMGGL